jgi:hypothetical protein
MFPAGSLNQAMVGPGPRKIPFFIRFEVLLVVMLETNSTIFQFTHGFVDVINGEIEDGEGRGSMIRLRIDKYSGVACKMEFQPLGSLHHLQSQYLAVELLCFL